jgi:hypothetical protein
VQKEKKNKKSKRPVVRAQAKVMSKIEKQDYWPREMHLEKLRSRKDRKSCRHLIRRLRQRRICLMSSRKWMQTWRPRRKPKKMKLNKTDVAKCSRKSGKIWMKKRKKRMKLIIRRESITWRRRMHRRTLEMTTGSTTSRPLVQMHEMKYEWF